MRKPASHRGCVLRESTPAIAEHTHTRSFQYGRLPQQREALLLDAEKVARLVPLDYSFDSVLRPVTPKLVDRVLHKLQSSDKPVIVDRRWVDFPADPSRSPESEADTFLPLVNIVKEITSASKIKGKQSILHYKSNPHAVPESTYRDNSSRPDGYLTPL